MRGTGKLKTLPREKAMAATHLDWDRKLCRKGCRKWVPWYQNKKGKQVFSCRIGEIPEKRDGQWYCRHRKATKQKGDEDRA